MQPRSHTRTRMMTPDGSRNGEWRLLAALRGLPLRCFFDVGAHNGDWTRAVLAHHPEAKVHCFEIEPSNRARLIQSIGRDSRAIVNSFGLASGPGSLDVWIDPDNPWRASTLGPLPDRAESTRRVSCRVDTGDHYLAEHEIRCIDFLKLDVEGTELDVLHGFMQALDRARVAVIQFEFTLWAPLARVWLKDFYDFLGPLGFSIGKVFPTYVEWRGYEFGHEIFVRANFLAVHHSRSDIFDRLR
jgi:FkbM family methyltransferase